MQSPDAREVLPKVMDCGIQLHGSRTRSCERRTSPTLEAGAQQVHVTKHRCSAIHTSGRCSWGLFISVLAPVTSCQRVLSLPSVQHHTCTVRHHCKRPEHEVSDSAFRRGNRRHRLCPFPTACAAWLLRYRSQTRKEKVMTLRIAALIVVGRAESEARTRRNRRRPDRVSWK